MDLELSLDGRPFHITLKREGERVDVEIDGEKHPAVVRRSPSGFLVEVGKKSFRIEFPDSMRAMVDGVPSAMRILSFSAVDPGAGAGASNGVLRPPMPGAIAKLLVQEGDKVEKGRPLVVLEAMKMQNELLAPFAGRVRKVHVKQGDTVTLRDVVLELEAE